MDKHMMNGCQSEFAKWVPDSLGAESFEEMISDAFVKINVDEIRERAYQDGYMAAKNEFDQHLQLKVDEAVNAVKDSLQQLYQELIAIKQEMEQAAQNELIALCLSIVKHICHKTFSEDTEVIQNMIQHGLSLMPSAEGNEVKIMVSEETFQKIASHINLHENEHLHFIVDDKLQLGDFVIDSPSASMDGVLEHRLEKLKLSL